MVKVTKRNRTYVGVRSAAQPIMRHMTSRPGYIAIDRGCGCHFRVYHVTKSGQMLGGEEFDSLREAVATTGRYNREGGGYAPSIMPDQYDGLTKAAGD